MTLSDHLRILRGNWQLLVACVCAGLLAATALTVLSTPVYRAQAQLFVSASAQDTAGAAGLQQGGQFAQQRVKSYADIVDSPRVLDSVVRELRLPVDAVELAERVEATAPLDTVLIDVTVEDDSARDARQIANAIALRFTEVAAELETPIGTSASPVKVSVVRYAALPTSPVSPRLPVNLALGLVLGLAAGIGIAVLRELLDNSLKTGDDISTTLSLPTIGVIGFDGDSAKQPLIVHDDPRSPRAEAFRQLRTNLRFLDVDHPPRSIVLTSSLPSEGKSTTACNLALALTQSGLRVVLVDGDLRRPRIADYLGLEGAVGLTDVLAGRVRADDVLQSWGDGHLQVLPSGRTPPNPSELLGSEQMRTLLADLEGRADLVLIDAPPLLPVTDAAILSTLCSGVVVVVRSGRTTREQASRAVDALRGVDAQVYGAVLNMAPTKGPDAYAYGYGYGSTTAPEIPEQSRREPGRAPGARAR